MIRSARSSAAIKSKALLLCLLFAFAAAAQVPGYQGKKFSFGYTLGLAPSVRNPNNLGSASLPFGQGRGPVDKFIFSFNAIHNLSADLVLGRRFSICGAFVYYRTKIDASDVYYQVPYSNIYYPYINYHFKELVQFSAMGFTAGMKFFGSKFIAPFGRYIKLEFSHQNVKAELADAVMVNANDPQDVCQFSPDHWYTPYSAISLAMGKQRIIANKLVVDFGLKGSLPLNRTTVAFGAGNDYSNLSTFVTDMSLYRANCLNYVSVYLGFNFLAF